MYDAAKQIELDAIPLIAVSKPAKQLFLYSVARDSSKAYNTM
eukprot:COSAG05_NODE_6567_length_937_cov_2.761337_1_plen_42_part_00